MPAVDLAYRPRLGGLPRLGGPAAMDVTLARAAIEASFALEAVRRPRVSPPERFAGREGYSPKFLTGFEVPLPTPTGLLASDVLPVEHSTDGRLDYQHFSVVMSKKRRMAMFVAVNIDGKSSVKVDRDRDVWFLDGRIPLEAQIGEELYADNLLDRGHLVRREDPNWGGQATALVANDDTFHFTNCSPQMGAFNQRTWLGMEDYILKNARAQGAQVSVFTGPVFASGDLDYRGVLIPKAYWKVIAFVGNDGKPSATAYTVDQKTELGSLEAAFGAYKTYQRSVKSIERLTGLSFNGLADYDGFSNEEAALGAEIAAELRSPGDVRV